MNIRQAMYASAAHIEANPAEFNFGSCRIPDSKGCGFPGCAIGWIAFFMGAAFPRSGASWQYGDNPLTVEDWVFYDRMTSITSYWHENANTCAATLRLYADKYHPAERKPMVLPNWSAIAAQRTVLPDAVSEDVRA